MIHVRLNRYDKLKMPGAFFAGVVFLLVSLFLTQTGLAQAASGSIWSIVNSPNASTASLSNNFLSGVSALSDSNVWAVGEFNSTTSNNINHTLVEHWDGKAWSIIPSPNVGSQGSLLVAVSALSPTDVWAVGTVNTGQTSNGDRTLIEHFDGKTWSVVPSPNSSQQGDNLTGVAALSANNVFAVGQFVDNTQTFILPLIEHFDGKVWSVVPNIPTNSGVTLLNAITARTSTDIWAVGESNDSAGNAMNFALHFNGTQWSITPKALFPSAGQQTLAGVAAIASNDAWAVGSFAPVASGLNDPAPQTLAIHWDGTKWSKVATPNVDTSQNMLFGVAAISSKDVWAVGHAVTTDGLGLHTLIERWDGTKWSIIPSPNQLPQGNNANSLLGVTVSGATTLWAVGSFDSLVRGNPGLRTLILHTTQG